MVVLLCRVCRRHCLLVVFFFKQKTAYEMRISDWSSDVCSSDLHQHASLVLEGVLHAVAVEASLEPPRPALPGTGGGYDHAVGNGNPAPQRLRGRGADPCDRAPVGAPAREAAMPPGQLRLVPEPEEIGRAHV